MDRKTMERIEHKLCAEIDEIAEKEELSIGDLDVIDKVTHSLKSMNAIKTAEGGEYSMNGGYSMSNGGGYNRNGNWIARGTYGNPMAFAGGNMGRYSNAEGPDEMREELKRMMDAGVLNAQQKEAAHKFMDALTK